MAELSIRQVFKSYGRTEVVHGLDLDVPHNEFLVLVGPSGCGKSTMLRMIAGLEDVTRGEIWIGDRLVNNVEPKNRNIAMVFQNYALYPHMTVRRNIGFGLRAARLPKPEIERRVREVAAILGLGELLDRKPAELSGGQRQRVSMGRAIVREPQVFLFDEPLSNLDAELRVRMRIEIKKLHQKVETTIVYVTHDQVEAMTLADRIVVMRDGRIQQVGTPMELFERPANLFVAGFIGTPAMNLLDGRITSRHGAMAVELAQGVIIPVPTAPPLAAGREVVLGIRPDDLLLAGDGAGPDCAFAIEAPIRVVEPMGAEAILYLDLANQEVTGKAHGRLLPSLGHARLTVATPHLHLFDKSTGLALA